MKKKERNGKREKQRKKKTRKEGLFCLFFLMKRQFAGNGPGNGSFDAGTGKREAQGVNREDQMVQTDVFFAEIAA